MCHHLWLCGGGGGGEAKRRLSGNDSGDRIEGEERGIVG